jgi:hypothetical protein
MVYGSPRKLQNLTKIAQSGRDLQLNFASQPASSSLLRERGNHAAIFGGAALVGLRQPCSPLGETDVVSVVSAFSASARRA